MALHKGLNLTGHDDLYAKLVALHEGLSDEDARRVDARLILLLMNHIGDAKVIAEALAAARGAAAA
jgi:hypothetical protein